MSSARAENAAYAPPKAQQRQGELHILIDDVLKQFLRMSKRYVLFHWSFLLLGFFEFIIFFLLLSSWAQTTVLAVTIATIFLTAFSYFILRLYLQAHKPEQFLRLRDDYQNACKQNIQYQEGIPEYHLSLARLVCKLAMSLHEKEYHFYSLPHWLRNFEPLTEKFSCWWHWKDVHIMKELLLFCSIEEHIKLVKCEPINLEFHAALANAYVMLSNLYNDFRKYDDGKEDRWVPPEKYSQEMYEKFRTTAQRAIEELKILNEYAPDDPWVHVQLAYNYHDLQMPEEEIREYETILRLCPDDRDTLFKLGMLYFQQGFNAKGLRAYERLKRSHYRKAEDLIKFYGAYAPYDAYVV